MGYVSLAAQLVSQLNEMRRTYETAWQLNDAFTGLARVPTSNDMFGVSKDHPAADNELKRQYKELDHELESLMHEECSKRALSNSSHLHN